ncbi:Uracil DNA glycosylase superfamily protein [Streptomyces sp. di188]|nr:Uracil DNA glycosylase superfamily protein [Streptomyces sp. di50b]SCE52360.1 Uracil DNA glycosylase superfamily protein [Streptomyces sp. di188]
MRHFKFTRAEPGKRRIHKAPTVREATACAPWLAAVLKAVKSELLVVLGATVGRPCSAPPSVARGYAAPCRRRSSTAAPSGWS